MSISGRFLADVKTLISAMGYDVTFRRVSGGTYSEGSLSGGTTDDETITAVFLEYKEDQVDERTIQRGDRRVVFSADGLTKTPQIGDLFIGTGNTVVAVSVREYRISDVAIAYSCQVRE